MGPQEPQVPLFADETIGSSRRLPVLGEQKDISYYGAVARTIVNGPETTGMDFWSINPYVGCAFGCAYCYARYAHRYTLERAAAADPTDEHLRQDLESMPPWLAFERRIFVKQNAAAALRKVLRSGSARSQALREHGVVIGTATDPYQPAERRYRVTRGVLDAIAEHPGMSVSIITKSPLVTRDIDVLARIAARADVTVHVSLITLDRELARRIEPRAPTPEARLRAVARLTEAGIDVGVNVMPVLPGITDGAEAMDALVRAVARAGAGHIAACALRLRGTARRRYLPFVEAEFPHLADRYRASYAASYNVGERYREGLRRHFAKLCAKYGIRDGFYDDGEDEEEAETGETAGAANPASDRVTTEQLGLEL
ncbi:MAG: radical SAM protein [Gemmatimonadota bacterium]|nr:radical SAM protein [Gemmatimonadota bacterium]